MVRNLIALLLACLLQTLVFCHENPSPKRWCNREFEAINGGHGVFKLDPPHWRPSVDCDTRMFTQDDIITCMTGRTLYVIGNSVARQSAFGLVEMLGGATVKREDQRDLCPKHETTWDDSCHQEYAGIKIKYLFLQFMDGYNYSNRKGFPFWERPTSMPQSLVDVYTAHKPAGIGNTPGLVATLEVAYITAIFLNVIVYCIKCVY